MKYLIFSVLLSVNVQAHQNSNLQTTIQAAYFRGDLIPLSLELVRSARSNADLVQREEQVNRLALLHGVCQTELRQAMNPYHCYRVIEIEETLKFIGRNAAKNTRTFLDERCSGNARESVVLRPEELHALSHACASAFHLAKLRQRYVLSETQPLSRFKARFEDQTPVANISHRRIAKQNAGNDRLGTNTNRLK